MKTINTKELHARLDATPVAIFDIRGDVEYEWGHIIGAKTAPRGSLSFRVASNMNPESFVVVYSTGEHDDGSRDAVERLQGLGMTNVYLYEEGIAGWRKAGHEIIASKNPKVQARGPVTEVRHLVVDRKRAYGGAFASPPSLTSAAGG